MKRCNNATHHIPIMSKMPHAWELAIALICLKHEAFVSLGYGVLQYCTVKLWFKSINDSNEDRKCGINLGAALVKSSVGRLEPSYLISLLHHKYKINNLKKKPFSWIRFPNVLISFSSFMAGWFFSSSEVPNTALISPFSQLDLTPPTLTKISQTVEHLGICMYLCQGDFSLQDYGRSWL